MAKQSVAGIVVKVTDAVIVLLCHDGTFKNVARPAHIVPPLIGERFTHIKKTVSWMKYTAIAAVFILTFISYMLLPFGKDDSAYVVAIDINPSIELTVNDAMKIIGTSANNPDGKTLLKAIKMKGDKLAVAIEKITTYSEEAGFFLEGKYLTTSVISVKEQKNHSIEEIEQIIESSISKPDIDVVVLRNNKATYDEAKKSNLSVNHYSYFKELENEGVVKTIDEVKGKSMAELRKLQKAKKAPVDKGESDKAPADKAPKSNESKQKKSDEPDSVGPTNGKKEKTAPPSHSKAEENKQQDKNQKDVKEKDVPENQGQSQSQGKEN